MKTQKPKTNFLNKQEIERNEDLRSTIRILKDLIIKRSNYTGFTNTPGKPENEIGLSLEEEKIIKDKIINFVKLLK